MKVLELYGIVVSGMMFLGVVAMIGIALFAATTNSVKQDTDNNTPPKTYKKAP